jgi:adenine-specific DNA-methyltransferase
MAEIQKQELTSMNIKEDQLLKLKQLFPEVFSEGLKVDWDKLKLTLGENIDAGKERYGMNWPGKAECFKTIQQPSIATLIPAKEESIDFDKTQNIFIEGDNLEVLKLLQKSYIGKIKVLYFDPPYNTGNDFIYPDNYSESLDTYLSYTGQVDGDGKKFATNTETDGRFHSKWLNMMYPRLFLAKNLLREDGVVFISIDDNEVTNLKSLCNEIFGEENFIGQFVINTTPNARDYGHIGKQHEYCLFYAKNAVEAKTNFLEDKEKTFKYKDAIGEYNIHPLYNSNVAFTNLNRPNLYYPFYLNLDNNIEQSFFEISLKPFKNSIEIYPPKSVKDSVQFVWRWGREKSLADLNKEIIGYKTEEGEYRIVQKMRTSSKLIRSLLLEKEFTSRRGTAEAEELFKKKIFSFPKPVELIKTFIKVGSSDDDIVLDIFAGGCTTAQAVIDTNKEEGGNRKYICIQLPQPIEKGSEADKAGYRTIADIGKARIEKVIERTKKEPQELFKEDITKLDLGFKVYKLAQSNFKIWDSTLEKSPEVIQAKLFEHINHISPEAEQEAILYELLLKSGFELTTPIEKLTLAGLTVFSIAEGQLLICLEKELSHDCLKAMAELHPTRVICLDEAFKGTNADALKTNAVQIMKSKGVVNFRTV